MLPPPADEEDEEEEGGGADAVEKKGKPSFPASAPMSQHSKSWDNAVFDDAIWSPGERIRYEVSIPLWDEGEVLPGLEADSMLKEEAPLMRVLVSLHPTYPNTAPPQLQLLGRYLGNFGIDAGLCELLARGGDGGGPLTRPDVTFTSSLNELSAYEYLVGDVTRTFITSSGVTFTPGDVCVFEGLTYARTVAQTWYATRLSTGAEGEKARDADRRRGREGRAMEDHFPTSPARTSHDRTGNGTGNGTGKDDSDEDDSAGASAPRRPTPPRPTFSYSRPTLDDTGAHGSAPAPTTISSSSSSMPLTTPPSVTQANEGFFPHFIIHVSAPIVDRKSTFIGHAIRVTDEREVPLVIHELLSDRKIAKAAHPAMFAYRIVREVGGVAGKVIQTGELRRPLILQSCFAFVFDITFCSTLHRKIIVTVDSEKWRLAVY